MPVVVVSHRYGAAADKVFDAWLTPALARRFFFATRTGNITQCDIEPQVGGQFTVTDRRPQADGDESVFDAEHRGTYLEVERPTRLVFEFNVEPFLDAPTRVTIDIAPEGPAACELVLAHDLGEGELAELYEPQTRQGWTRMLERLEREIFPRREKLARF